MTKGFLEDTENQWKYAFWKIIIVGESGVITRVHANVLAYYYCLEKYKWVTHLFKRIIKRSKLDT